MKFGCIFLQFKAFVTVKCSLGGLNLPLNTTMPTYIYLYSLYMFVFKNCLNKVFICFYFQALFMFVCFCDRPGHGIGKSVLI